MRTDLAQLPRRAIGVSYTKTGRELRCDVSSMGLTRETDPARYRFDNRRRQGGALFQYTLYGEGRFEETDTGRVHGMYPGTGFLARFPSETRYWLPEEREWEFLYICFGGDLACHHVDRLVGRGGPVFRLPTSSAAVEVLIEMYAELAAGRAPDEFAASRDVYRFLMELYAARQRPAASVPEDVARAQALVEKRYADSGLTVADLARAAGYSKYHFSRRFKAATGVSPHAYLVRRRLRASLELLANTDQPIKQIALAVGFNDYPYFCNAFKRHTLYTPASVRREQERFRFSELLTGR